jgi:hypothetical protein
MREVESVVTEISLGAYADNPEVINFTVATAEELALLAQIVNGTWGGIPERDNFSGKTITLMNNIDLFQYDNWVPIGNYALDTNSIFSGTFDGGGYVISNLTINRPDSSSQGLFGYIRGGQVRNLGLVNVNIRGRQWVGGLAGFIDNSRVDNCYTTGKISGVAVIGGVIGFMKGIIRRYSVICAILPGEIFDERSSMVNSYSTDIIGDEACVDTTAEFVEKSIVANSYSAAMINGETSVGGVVGYVEKSMVINSYSVGTVIGNACVGGIVGRIMGEISFGGSAGSGFDSDYVSDSSAVYGIYGCAALNPEVEGNSTTVGRVVGCSGGSGILLSNNVAYNEMKNAVGNASWDSKGANRLDGEDITIATIRADKTIGGRFNEINGWTIEDGWLPGLGTAAKFPTHFGTAIYRVAVLPVNIFVGKGGTQLFVANVFGWDVDKTVAWTVSGNSSQLTTINVDGLLSVAANETASSLIVTATSTANTAASDAVTVKIMELNGRYAWYTDVIAANHRANHFTISTAEELMELAQIVNGTLGGKSVRDNFAGKTIKLANNIDLARYENWEPIGNRAINGDNIFSGTFDGAGYVISNLTINYPDREDQGLFGHINRGSVKNLGLVNVNIYGNRRVGAVAGSISCGSIIDNSYSTGKVRGAIIAVDDTSYASRRSYPVIGNIGGIVGYIGCSSVMNSYSTAMVSGNDAVGGVAGMVGGRFSCASCNADIGERSNIVINSYSTGKISGRNQVGGVAGNVGGGSLSNCYSTATVSGTHLVGGIVGWIVSSNLNNCYSTGAISGNCLVGGVAGDVRGVSVTNCAALNSEVKAIGPIVDRRICNNPRARVGRVSGSTGNSTFPNNIAYVGSIVLPPPPEKTDTGNGANITLRRINADGTLGGLFKRGDGWTTENGKLPGLRGRAVEMPEHLR